MTENCCETSGTTTMLLPCSGGSNVGQLASRAPGGCCCGGG